MSSGNGTVRTIDQLIGIIIAVEFYDFWDIPNVDSYVAQIAEEVLDVPYIAEVLGVDPNDLPETVHHALVDGIVEELTTNKEALRGFKAKVKVRVIMDWFLNGQPEQ